MSVPFTNHAQQAAYMVLSLRVEESVLILTNKILFKYLEGGNAPNQYTNLACITIASDTVTNSVNLDKLHQSNGFDPVLVLKEVDNIMKYFGGALNFKTPYTYLFESLDRLTVLVKRHVDNTIRQRGIANTFTNKISIAREIIDDAITVCYVASISSGLQKLSSAQIADFAMQLALVRNNVLPSLPAAYNNLEMYLGLVANTIVNSTYINKWSNEGYNPAWMIGRIGSLPSLAAYALDDPNDYPAVNAVGSVTSETFVKSLGKGAYGEVSLVQVTIGGVSGQAAVKKQWYTTASGASDPYQAFLNEVSIMRSCDNVNVVKCVSFRTEATPAKREYYFYMEPAVTSLDSMINEQGNFNTEANWIGVYLNKTQLADSNKIPIHLRRSLGKDMADGLMYLQSQGILHRDFKPANVLVYNDGRGSIVAKLADFGLAETNVVGSIDFEKHTLVGTMVYRSPELHSHVLNGNRLAYYGFEQDIWALGITLLEMETGVSPLWISRYNKTALGITDGQLPRGSSSSLVSTWDTYLACARLFGSPPTTPMPNSDDSYYPTNQYPSQGTFGLYDTKFEQLIFKMLGYYDRPSAKEVSNEIKAIQNDNPSILFVSAMIDSANKSRAAGNKITERAEEIPYRLYKTNVSEVMSAVANLLK